MAFRYTPTPTPSITPTISLTPSISPSNTPSSTPCPYVCCLPSGFTTGIQVVSNLFLADNNNILIGGTLRPGEYSGNSLANEQFIRIDSCGNLKQIYQSPAPLSTEASNHGGFAKQSDGKIIVAGNRTLWRLNADFTPDTTFTSGRTNVNVFIKGVGVNSQDEIIIVGNFGTNYTTTAGTVSFNTNIYKLSSNGVPDTSYSGKSLTFVDPAIEPFDNQVYKDVNGKIIVVGFQGINGNSNYQGIIRLNDDFSLDTTFQAAGFISPAIGRGVYTQESLSNGQYLVGGSFTNYSGFSNQDFLIRLNNNGTLDTTFDYSELPAEVVDIAVQSTGKIIVADVNNTFRRINSNGSVDPTWTTGTTTSSTVYFESSLLVFPNDQLMVGGSFNTYNSQNYPKLVKTDENGNLNVCPFPSATPTNTPTNTNTPSATPTKTPGLSPSPTQTCTPTPSFVSYIYAGTTNLYGTDTLACNNKTCGRPWYKAVPTWAIGTVVYDDSALTTPLVGGNNWIAVSTSTGTYCGGGWAAVQVDNAGVILNFVSCP